MADSPVENWIRSNPGQHTARDIADAVGQSLDTADGQLRRLEQRGLVRRFRVGHGPNLWRWVADPDQEESPPPARKTPPSFPSGYVLSNRVDLVGELLELEKQIAAATIRRAEILALLT